MAALSLFDRDTLLRPTDIKLWPYQEEALAAIRGEFASGKKSTLLVLPTGCHAPDQGILMFDMNVRTAGAIKVGDRLMGPDGTARTVIVRHEGRDRMLRVVPQHGKPFVVTKDHRLTMVHSMWDVSQGDYKEAARKGILRDFLAFEVAGWPELARSQYRLIRSRFESAPGWIEGPPLSEVTDTFSMEEAGEGDYVGFTVDGDNRYLLDDFTVTHNCGKTITFGMAARRVVENGGKVLVLAHRGELIDQAYDTFVRLGLDPAIEKASQYARALDEPEVVIATVQTMQGDRLKSWAPNHFRLLVTDECHHAPSDSYKRIFMHFKDAWHLGVTATADRADEVLLGEVYESVAYEYSLWEAMTAEPPGPYLCRLRFVQCDVGIDLRDIRTTGGDFNQGDLEEAIRPHVETLANAIKQEIGQRKTLVFTPDVGSAQAMAAAMSQIGLVATWASGNDPDRKQKVSDFKEGKYQVCCNCALLTEGFDAPDTAAIALCRPTKSRSLYAQMAGRATRIAPGKSDAILIDFNWLTEKHKLVKPIELFDTTHTNSETLEIATDLLKKTKGRDLLDVIEEAETEQKRRQVLRVKARERAVSYRRVEYDPLSAMEVLGVPVRRQAQSLLGTATERQVELLAKFKIESPEKMSRRAATLLLDSLIARSRANLATHKQVAWLIRLGMDPQVARSMTMKQASAELDRHFTRRN